MVRKSLIISVLVWLLGSASVAFAHAPGQQPYFKINGQYTLQYPINSTAVKSLEIPQDIGAENYLVNTPINFQIDTQKLPFPPEITQKTQFFWEYGDGSRAQGLKNTHTYSKAGPYIMILKARYSSDYEAQLLQSTLVNVLPSKDYKLPKAMIQVNDTPTNPSPMLKLDITKPLVLDGGISEGGAAKIASFFWDLGDQQTSTQAIVRKNYANDFSRVFTVLRVTDTNGFYSDTLAEIENTQVSQARAQVVSVPEKSSGEKIILAVLGFGVIIFLAFLFWKKRTKQA